MAEYIKQDEFINIANQHDCDARRIITYIKENLYEDYSVNTTNINTRIANYRRKGLLSLDSGNSIDTGTILKGTSTLYDDEGNIVQQWVKTDVPKENALRAYQQAIESIADNVTPAKVSIPPSPIEGMSDLLTVYPIGDAHVGMLSWHRETGDDHDLAISKHRLINGSQLAIDQAISTDEAYIIDVGRHNCRPS